MAESCPGFATYQTLSNGQVLVNGQVPLVKHEQLSVAVQKAWREHGAVITRVSQQSGIPVHWFVGIMMAESKGNQYACSPCSLCNASLCAEGAGQRCCAFGLMQMIAPTANKFGATPTQLMQSTSASLTAAARYIQAIAAQVGGDLVRVAVAYNAGVGALDKCGKSGTTFGWHTNGNYPMDVVQYANTFLALRLAPPAPVTSIVGALLATVGVGIAAGIYTGKIRWR
jgi:soluble lytic murein transglycosylase-like protein